MDLKESLEILKSFLSPVNTNKLEKINISEITFADILKSIIVNFEEKHPQYYANLKIDAAENDILWIFGQICLNIINTINESKFETNPYNCYLSIADEKLVASCCQLVTCFCVHYNLEDNVGVSIDKLSKYGVNITKYREKIDVKKRNIRLIEFLIILHKIKQNKKIHVDFISGIFYRKYMHETLCALIQVCYSMNSQANDDQKILFTNWLEKDLFEEADGALIVSNLIMVQGSSRSKSMLWLFDVIGKLLTKCLLRPNSVMNVIRAVLSQINALSDVTLASDWKKCDIVAKILVQCPKDVKIEDYIKFIAPQIINLYFHSDIRYARHFYRVAGSLYSLFAQRYPQLTRKYLTEKIIHPFKYDLTKENKNEVILSSKELCKILSDLHNVYVTSTEPNWQTLQQIPLYLIYLIFDIYVILRKKINSKQTFEICQNILKLYFSMKPNTNNELCEFLSNILKTGLINDSKNQIDYIILDESKFQNFEDPNNDEEIINDLIDLNKTTLNEENNDKIVTLDMVENRAKSIIDLMKLISDKDFDFNFMFHLFNQINNYYKNKISNVNYSSSNNDQTLLQLENNIASIEKEINLKIVYFTQLSYLFEHIDPKLIIDKQHEKVIQFCHHLLKNIITIIKKNSEILILEDEENKDNKNKNEYETIHLILSIISIFTSGLVELESNVKKDLQILLPILNELKSLEINEELISMSESLYISIATYCGIKSNHIDTNKKILIEEFNNNNLNKNGDDDYEKAIKDLNDPLIPVRAHGLVAMRKLIDQKNEKCIQNKDKLIDMFIRNLKFDDSYVYLAAIMGLISLVDFDRQKILDLLLNEYILNNDNKKLDVEAILKIGEVLTKTVRNFSELVPTYGTKFIHAFLIGCKHQDEMIRSSSLSNLGETCKLLKYSLSSNIYEIINCLSSLIEFDQSLQVKRSATMVLKMIIEGLKKENFLSILDKSILPLYKLLNKTKSITNDDIIKLNCQLTNEYLNELMKESMFPTRKLEKEIKILRP